MARTQTRDILGVSSGRKAAVGGVMRAHRGARRRRRSRFLRGTGCRGFVRFIAVPGRVEATARRRMAGIRFRIISAVQGLSVPSGLRYAVTGFTATNPGKHGAALNEGFGEGLPFLTARLSHQSRCLWVRRVIRIALASASRGLARMLVTVVLCAVVVWSPRRW